MTTAMRKTNTVLSLLLIILAIYWSFTSQMPDYSPDGAIVETQFSTDRAMEHVIALSQKPHAVGFPDHAGAKTYLVKALWDLGLEVRMQEATPAGIGQISAR